MALTSVEVGGVYFAISNLENTKDGRSLMVSSMLNRRVNKLAQIVDVEKGISMFRHEYPFSGYTEFSKTNDRRFVITQDELAQIVDVETGTSVFRSSNEDSGITAAKYAANRATFSYDDNLILSYGTLWDVRCPSRDSSSLSSSGALVDVFRHGFDCFEGIVSGVFHPNGHDVIIGSHVWDIRTYRHLLNIPSLKSSRIIFNNRGDFFYSCEDTRGIFPMNPMARGQNLFQCYESRDYSVVATVNTNKVIQSLAVDPKDLGVAVIENSEDGYAQGQCRVFSVGYKWSSSSTYDYEDDVTVSDDEDLNESDLEFMADVDFDDLMYSDSDDASTNGDNISVEDDDDEEAEDFLSGEDSDTGSTISYGEESDLSDGDDDSDSGTIESDSSADYH